MIIDNHAHIFPFLGGNSEYKSPGIQLRYAQKTVSTHWEPAHRKSDFRVVEEAGLWDKNNPGIDGITKVNFRAGKFGRYDWTVDGIDYCKQFMPVGLQDMVSSPAFIIAQMDYVGIDKAVLQRNHVYGKLDEFYHAAIKQYPNRFIGLTQIDESKAYEDEQINELRHAIDELKLSGLYFEPGALWMENFKYKFDDTIFNSFWDEVDSMSIPIYAQTDRSQFIEEMKGWKNILEKHPDLILVISMGLPETIVLKDGEMHIPEVMHRLLTNHKVFLDVAYPISVGMKDDYPYYAAQKIIRHLFYTFGADRLIWGSDIPNVERYCTYAQSLNYLRKYCDFLSDNDKELVFAKNVIKVFGLDSQSH